MFSREVKLGQLAVKRASLLTKRISDEIAARTVGGISKSDDSPVTVGDFAAQSIIINSIKKAFPNDEVVGEEDSAMLKKDPKLAEKVLEEIKWVQEQDKANNGSLSLLNSVDEVCDAIDGGSSEGGRQGRIWALDPIDGTKGFLRGDQFAVCLALIVDGVVKVGVIGCPNLPFDLQNKSKGKGGLFTAAEGVGSYYQNLFEEILPLESSKRITMNNSLSFDTCRVCEGVEKGHSSHGLQGLIKEKLQIKSKSANLDSQAKYCALSRGDAEIYLRLPKDVNYREKIWDHAAGNILIKESGGIVSDIYGNQLDFGNGRELNSQGIIAASKNLHSDIITAVKSIIGDRGQDLEKYI